MTRRPSSLFFYGTLMDGDLLARVAGCVIDPARTEPATIAGYRRSGVAGERYPILVPYGPGRAEGLLVRDLSQEALRRLVTYEGADFRLAPVTVTTARGEATAAAAFLNAGPIRPSHRDWRLAAWQRRWKKRALRRADWIARGRS